MHAIIPIGIVGGFERITGEAMDICLRVLKESNKSRFDSYSSQEQCIGHIPYCHSGLSRAQFFPTTFLEIALCILWVLVFWCAKFHQNLYEEFRDIFEFLQKGYKLCMN